MAAEPAAGRRRGGRISPATRSTSGRDSRRWPRSCLLLSGGYHRLERITTVLVAAVTLFTVASVLILQFTSFRITAADLGNGFELVIPPAALALAFSAFGITGVGASELVAYPYWCIEKGYARYAGRAGATTSWAHRARGWTRVMQLDAWFSMVVFTVATVAFYFLGAAVLHPQGLDPKGPEMIPTLSRMYLQPLEGTPWPGWRRSRGSASCWGPGPSCSRRCTSPRRPTAG